MYAFSSNQKQKPAGPIEDASEEPEVVGESEDDSWDATHCAIVCIIYKKHKHWVSLKSLMS